MRGQILGATGVSDRALLYKSYPGKSSLPQKLGHTGCGCLDSYQAPLSACIRFENRMYPGRYFLPVKAAGFEIAAILSPHNWLANKRVPVTARSRFRGYKSCVGLY